MSQLEAERRGTATCNERITQLVNGVGPPRDTETCVCSMWDACLYYKLKELQAASQELAMNWMDNLSQRKKRFMVFDPKTGWGFPIF